MANRFNEFLRKQNVDPFTFHATALGGGGLGGSLLAGRQQRIDVATQAAERAAAARKERISNLKSGIVETPQGFQQIKTITDPTGGTSQVTLDESGQFSATPLLEATPKAPKPPSFSHETIIQDGVPTVVAVNKNDPSDIRPIGPAPTKGGDRANAPPGSVDPNSGGELLPPELVQTDLDAFAAYFPVNDRTTGAPISLEKLSRQGLNRDTMEFTEKNTLATGVFAGFPSIQNSAKEIDGYRTLMRNREFIDGVIAAKNNGATFGPLSDNEGAKLEGFRTIMMEPNLSPQQFMQEYVKMDRYTSWMIHTRDPRFLNEQGHTTIPMPNLNPYEPAYKPGQLPPALMSDEEIQAEMSRNQ